MKEDVIDFKLDLMCDQYKAEIENMDTEELLRHHFDFLKRNTQTFTILYLNGLHQLSVSKFAALLPYTMPLCSDDPIEQLYYSEFNVSGIEAISRTWISREFRESLDEVVEIAKRNITGQSSLNIK